MATIITRAGKGSPLTNNEVDANFTNLNDELALQIASNVIVQVRNATGATLTKGTVVYITGATGQLPTVSKAIATADSTSAQTLGLISADLPNNTNGTVTITGLVTNIDTSAYTDGAQLYLSGTTAGTFTATKTLAPTHLVYVGVVEYAHITQGKIFVKVQNGYEIDEIHDVAITTPTTGDTIVYNSATSLWENKATKVDRTSSTGSLVTPTGTTGQRDATPSTGAIRYNTTIGVLEMYDGSAWTSLSSKTFTFGGTGVPTLLTAATPYLRVSTPVKCVGATLTAKTAPTGNFTVSILRSADSGSTFPDTVATVTLGSGAKTVSTSATTALNAGDLLRIDITSVNAASDWTCQLYTR